MLHRRASSAGRIARFSAMRGFTTGCEDLVKLLLRVPTYTIANQSFHRRTHVASGLGKTQRGSLPVRTAAIIAGGRAQRLGGLEKSDLVIGGRRIVDRQLSVLGHVAEHILIVSNDHHAFRASGLQVCADLMPGAGPLSGLYTALVRSPTARTIVVACGLAVFDSIVPASPRSSVTRRGRGNSPDRHGARTALRRL